MYKSRTLASDAMKGGKVKLNSENVKPAHLVKIGERYTLTIGHTRKIIEVLALVDRRGNFEFAKQFYADHSPEPEKKGEEIPSAFFKVNIARARGAGRPTKKDRRDQEDMWGN
jgi:ribosome-associated heat shock protein Hsp15